MSQSSKRRGGGGEKVMESWVGPGNGTMVAANLSTWPHAYFASPGGRAPIEFRVRESGDKRMVFENLAHDYPQRISYWRDGPSLVARIEGTLRGEKREQEWRFRAN